MSHRRPASADLRASGLSGNGLRGHGLWTTWPFRVLALLAGLAALAGSPAQATSLALPTPAEVRAAEIRECRPGDIATWGDGRDTAAPARTLHFAYDPTHAPGEFPPELVRTLLRAALDGWAGCGLTLAITDGSPGAMAASAAAASVRQIGWLPPTQDNGKLIGGADLARGYLLLSPKVFALLRERNPALMVSSLQMTLSHEIGHFLGLVAHSRRCVDVTSYYHDGKGHPCLTANIGGIRSVKGVVEYRSALPTACDIARCRRANAARWGLED